MKTTALLFALLLCLACPALASAESTEPPDALKPFQGMSGSLDIAGGTAHIPVMKDAAKNIMEAQPGIRITVTGGGSGVGVQKVGEGLVQIGNTGRALKEAEIEKYGLLTWPFAIDGVAVAVHPSNPVGELGKEQLQQIFSGRIANWKELGGADAAINLYIREDGSGTRETFEERALGGVQPASRSNVVSSNGAMKTAVAQDKNAIGYVGIGHLDEQIKAVSFEGAAPTQDNAKSGSYTVTRLLYMNTKGEPEALTRAFIDYIYSPGGEALIRKAGYIPTGRP